MNLLLRIPFLSQLSVLFLSCGFSVLLLVARMIVSQERSFLFLVWNLFLAIVPVVVSYFSYLHYLWRGGRIGIFFFGLLCVWLIFFPNSPYIVTDFVHLRARHSIPIWFDILLIFSFAWSGFFAGLISLRMIHLILSDRIGVRSGWLFILSVAPITSLGICIGRFYRWNSWDVLENPRSLLLDSLDFLGKVIGSARLAGVLGLMSLGLILAYLLILSVGDMRRRKEKNS
ncbi:hypothetical protein CH371_16895 [Leptospira wolffii]|uniref:DUF1361 domain-containing protein n=1 Tax=Leptospira wolffii TaxID=409998 RepID=A0A2M9Z8P2_9LEPT|nr:DUF1361 domain-containing protein [Leptospira wolffii]PJZ64793.1 hypothetical protein CH371_16895 [Leptospira wolffii]